MQDFVIRFFISNFFIAGFIGMILTAKQVLRKHLSCQAQYHIWFFVFAALGVPFLPVRSDSVYRLFSLLLSPHSGALTQGAGNAPALTEGVPSGGTAAALHDFTVSVSRNVPSSVGTCLFLLWLLGLLVTLLLLARARIVLFRLERSAFLLQNREVKHLFQSCLQELKIKRNIAVYSTAFLKSPVTLGMFRPRIYLPLHLISDFQASDMRYLLLHELQHYRHRDAWVGCLMNLAGIIYWFNPAVRHGLKKMKDDRELACDDSVLQLLDAAEYKGYGNTLILFAEKVSHSPSPFSSGIGGDFRQIRQRIVNIAGYRPATRGKKIKSILTYILLAAILTGSVPALSAYAAQEERYRPDGDQRQISSLDLSAYFTGYDGCFILCDTTAGTWSVYNQPLAEKRVSPDSTYKIYSALMGLEAGCITAENSDMAWNETSYPFAEWNQDQNLTTAMQNSVNWYFQNLDGQTGAQTVRSYLNQIEYGNEDISAGLTSCWLESSLKISPFEQAELLRKLLAGTSGFGAQNVRTVKDTLLIQADTSGRLYGKTGTGAVNGLEVNGWFIGFVESPQNTYVFSLNIQGDSDAGGTRAKEIAMRILQDMQL